MYQSARDYVPYSPVALGRFPPQVPYDMYARAWHNPQLWASYEDQRRSGFSLSSLFGGGSKTVSQQEAITRSAAELITKNIMECSGSQTVAQSVTVSGNYNVVKVKQVMFMKLSAECTQDVQNIADMQTKITDDLMAQVKTQSQALIGALGRSDSDVRTKIEQDVKNTVTAENIQRIVNNVNMSQETTVSGDNNIVEVTQEQAAELVTSASQELLNSMTTVQELSKSLKTTAETTQSNFISEIIDSVFDGMGEIALIIACVVIAGIIFLGRELIKGGFVTELLKGKGSDPPPAPTGS